MSISVICFLIVAVIIIGNIIFLRWYYTRKVKLLPSQLTDLVNKIVFKYDLSVASSIGSDQQLLSEQDWQATAVGQQNE
jgi:hypothetical protein